MAQINPTDEIVTLVNTFTVEPQRQSELLGILDKVARDVMSKFPGFISANLHASLDGSRVLNYAQWRDQDSLQRAISHPDFLPHYEACNEISSAEPVLYRVSSVEEAPQDARLTPTKQHRSRAAGSVP